MTTAIDDEQKGSEIVISFCNGSEERFVYEDDSWSDLVARDAYSDWLTKGELNLTVFAKFPHIHQTTFTTKGQSMEHFFKCPDGCRCKEDEEQAG